MQTASTNVCERLCNRSTCEISLLLNIPWLSVSGIVTKWRKLETTATQPGSGRPCKMTEQVQLMLNAQCIEVDNCLQSQWLKTSKLHVAFRLAQQQCIESFMKWVSMAEQLHP
ncbi:unnamed protein product, partial [Staurois parvus]